jgi:predicted RNA-binding Zn-ribbon protein involved in translation (DUF1610 family)
MEKVRCKNITKKKGREYTCNRFLLKINNKEITVPCPDCGHLAIISVLDNNLFIAHLDKAEEVKCQKRM